MPKKSGLFWLVIVLTISLTTTSNLVLGAQPSPVASSGLATNIQGAAIRVEPFSGAAGFSIPIEGPMGRGGIQPNAAIVYNSNNRQLGNAGVGWTLDFGSIVRSTKKGVPTYNDSIDTFVMAQGGDLIKDPNSSNRYYPEVEGGFAKIEYFATYWLMTDKKGTKYYFGNTEDSRQYDPAAPTHIFRWALNKVEDLNGNFMTITYLKDNGQIYPKTIDYGGNSIASLTNYAKITINYESTTQSTSSYISGFKISNAQRIASITSTINGTNLYTYRFTYKQSANTKKDLLASVQQSASNDAISLPAITFNYTDTASKGFQIDPTWNLATIPYFAKNNGRWIDMGVRSGDLNADGYPDLILYSTEWGGPNENVAHLHNKQKAWQTTSNWKVSINQNPLMPPGFDTYASEIDRYNGVNLLDINGDGYADTIQNFRRDMYYGGPYHKSARINNGQNAFVEDSAWHLPDEAMVNYELGQPTYNYTVPGGTNFADINGDGLVDVAVSRYEWYPNHNVYFNSKGLNSASKGWNLSTTYKTPTDIDFTKGATMIDLNADGLADIIYLNAGSCRVFMNTGSNWQEVTGGFTNTLGLGNLTNGTTQLVDINGDGLPDLVIADGNASNSHVLINTGSGWTQDDAWNLTGVNFSNTGTQIFDADGNGLTDYIISNSSQQSAYINKGQLADLLVSVNNGIGASSTIEYDSSLHYQNTFLPFAIPVVKSMTTSVGTQNYKTSYSYAGGLFDVAYREFQGFKTITTTDPQGNYSVSNFDQRHFYKGRPLDNSTYDSTGKLYNKSVTQWSEQDVVTGKSKFIFATRGDSYVYDGNATGRRTAQQMFYDSYGNVTKTVSLGEVDLTTGADIGTDSISNEVEYLNNTSLWMIGTIKHSTAKDQNGTIFAQSWLYYDSATDFNTIPTKGFLTKKSVWSGDTTPTINTTYSYNSLGNLISTTDPKGNATTITYDTTYQMFPIRVTNALGHITKTIYYGVNESEITSDPLYNSQLKGLWGQTAAIIDSNNQKVFKHYDALGRILKTYGPLDSFAFPSAETVYEINPTYLKITNKSRITALQAPTIDTVDFFDGLGRAIQSKSVSAQSGQYIVGGQKVYDSRGQVIKAYLPRFTTSNLNTIDPIDESTLSATVTYDAMGRTIRTDNNDGTYSNVIIDDWKTIARDENGHQTASYADAYGRLITKEEYTGSDGRFAAYPAQAYALYATTNYQYDVAGNLLKTIDTKGNQVSITYDKLGRKIQMVDPDMGTWSYAYDANGNMTQQTDAKNQTIYFTYDALNRLTRKYDQQSLDVTYKYDDAFITPNAKGRMTEADYGLESTTFKYDEIGRELQSIKTINGTQYNVQRNYDDLNRLINITYPDGGKLYYKYNAAGQIQKIGNDPSILNQSKLESVPSKLEQLASNVINAVDWILGVGSAEADTTIATVEAESMTTKTTGGAVSNYWSIWSNGYIQHSVTFPAAGSYKIVVRAFGTVAGGVWPTMVLRLDNATAATTTVSNPNFADYTFTVNMSAGAHLVGVQFTNDATIGSEDRNLNVDKVTVIQVSTSTDTTAPSVPTNLSGTSPSTSQINLTWSSSTDNVGVTGYKIYRDGTQIATSTTNSYQNTGLTANTTYSYTVSAYDAAGNNSAQTAAINVKTQAPAPDTTAPSTPSGLTATTVSTSQINLSWTASTDNVGVTGYKIYRGGVEIASSTTTSYQNTGLTAATQYSYTVKAYDAANNLSAASNTATATTQAPLVEQQMISIEAENMTTKTIGGNSNGGWMIWGNGYIENAVTFPTTGSYKFVIRAYGSVAAGGWPLMSLRVDGTNPTSTTVATTAWTDYTFTINVTAGSHLIGVQFTNDLYAPPEDRNLTVDKVTIYRFVAADVAAPSVPMGLSATTVSGTQINLTWNASTDNVGVTGYKIFRNGTQIATSTTANYSNTGLTAGTPYSYTVSAYDAAGNNSAQSTAVNVSTPSAVVTYVQDVQYTALGQISKTTLGNGVTTEYFYDSRQRLKRQLTKNGAQVVLQDLNYTYDGVGNILSINDATPTDHDQTFSYDDLNRLKTATGYYSNNGSTQVTKNYSYDEIGNIILKDGKTYTYAEGGAGKHAVTKTVGGGVTTTYTYDANGNMATKQEGTQITFYAYDVENRLKQVKKGTSAATATILEEYKYDGDGGRTQKLTYNNGTLQTTTKFVGAIYEEVGSQRTGFISMGSQRIASISNGEVMYYLHDHLGGTAMQLDVTAAVKEITEYEPFGDFARQDRPGGGTNVAHYYFTNQYKDDATGLYFYNARYYDPKLGRFIQPDSIVQNDNPQNLNRYSYCGNNPINRIDPSGHKWSWGKFFTGVAGAIVGIVATVLSAGALAPLALGAFWTGALSGAIGGALGGITTSAISGGNIGQGALFGAIGGLVGGGLGVASKWSGGWGASARLASGGLALASIASAGMSGNWDGLAGGFLGGYLGSKFVNSEQFKNWKAGNGFRSNADVTKDAINNDIQQANNDKALTADQKAELMKKVIIKVNMISMEGVKHTSKINLSEVLSDLGKCGVGLAALGFSGGETGGIAIVLNLKNAITTGASCADAFNGFRAVLFNGREFEMSAAMSDNAIQDLFSDIRDNALEQKVEHFNKYSK